MKKRKTFAVVSSVVLSIYLTILLPNQVTFADENIEERSEKKDVTTQTLYWQCVEQDTGKVLKTIKANTVKVINGVPEKKFFYMGKLPEKIGNLEIAGNPWGGRDLEVDPNNKSGVVYLKAGYWDAEAYEKRSKNNFGWGDPKQISIINTTLMEYKACHGTDEGYIAPGYYDDDNMFHATMTVEEWKKKNHMPLGDETKQKQQSSNESKEIENKNSSSVVNTNEVEKSNFPNESEDSEDNDQSQRSVKRIEIKQKTNSNKSINHTNPSTWIYIGSLVIVLLLGSFLIPKRFWRKIFGGKGRHSK